MSNMGQHGSSPHPSYSGTWPVTSLEANRALMLDVKPGNDMLLSLLAHWPELIIWLLVPTKVPEVLVLSCTLEEESQKYSRNSTNDYHISSFIDFVCLGFPVKPTTSTPSSDFLP